MHRCGIWHYLDAWTVWNRRHGYLATCGVSIIYRARHGHLLPVLPACSVCGRFWVTGTAALPTAGAPSGHRRLMTQWFLRTSLALPTDLHEVSGSDLSTCS